MIINIRESTTVRDFINAFTAAYPYLHLEFYQQAHGFGEPSALAEKIDPDSRLADITNKPLPGVIEIHEWQRTGDLEGDFGSLFGLHLQVYRLEAGIRVQTTQSDPRTLAEQNQAAANLPQELMDDTDPGQE